jgi:DNA-binding Lrp family transcriptional regulator
MTDMLTAKDKELIALLQLNAREPVASLARKLGVSRTTVQDRLKRLEDQGVISGYRLKLSNDLERGGIYAYINLAVEPRRSVEITASLSKIPEIEAIYSVSGKFDALVLVRAESPTDMDRVLDAIGMIQGVKRTESSIVLSTKLDRR